MSANHQGDLHNFGQAVHAVERASGTYFQKPRPIYWEWLFFGKASPLMPFFSKKGDRGLSPGDCLFHLEVEMNRDFTGLSRRIKPSTKGEVTAGHAYSLGVLLAYCYVFGIRDLHRYNLVRTDTHLQVVDAEVVLVNLLLPNETLLLPFKDIGPELAAIAHLNADPSALSLDTVTEILKGYHDTFACILDHLDSIQRIFRDRREEMLRIPVRHIMRDTVHYRRWKKESPELPFFSDELEQLERGDIPYFFKFIGDARLYKYTHPSGSFAAVTIPTKFERAVYRDATDPEELLKRDRLESTLHPTGLLFLANRLLDKTFIGSIRLGDAILTRDSAIFCLRIGNQRFQSRK